MGRYLVALGSNMRHPHHGSPSSVLRAALGALGAQEGVTVERGSPIMASTPLGPSRRRYANGAAIVRTADDPPALLARLQRLEWQFGRKRRGAMWGARVLDLDIVLWSGGAWSSPGLTIPHPEFRRRLFVLGPASHIADGWRDPLGGLRVRHLHARLTRRSPLPS